MLAVLVVIGIVAGFSQNSARNQGRSDALTLIVRSIISPGSGAIDSLVQVATDKLGAWNEGPRLKLEVERLKRYETAAKMYGSRIEGVERQLQELRKSVQAPNFGREKIWIRITGYFPYENRVTVNRGREDGIAPGMPLVNSDGLLGLVQTVDQSTSQVLLACSPTVKFGGMVLNKAQVFGIVKGQTPVRLVLDVLESGDVDPGDLVYTSGFSTKIPQGVQVGTVVEVIPDQSDGTRRILVSPSARVGTKLEAYILK